MTDTERIESLEKKVAALEEAVQPNKIKSLALDAFCEALETPCESPTT